MKIHTWDGKAQKARLLLAQWLTQPKLKTDGGWAGPVTDQDILDLDRLISAIVEARVERDPDGDLSLEWTVTDRTKYERLHYRPVPYDDSFSEDTADQERLDRHADAVMLNFDIATNELERLFRCYQITVRHKP